MSALHPAERAALRRRQRPAEWRAWRRASVIALPIVLAITLAVGLAWGALLPAAAPVAARPQPAGVRTVAAPAYAAPAAGTTGTVALLPEPDRIQTGAYSGGSAAQPFRTGRATARDRGRALDCLATAIYYEAASESDGGQRAVAQVILNRVRHPAFPATVCGVVYQGSEQRGCQFSFACDGALARVPSRTGFARAVRVAASALAGQVYPPVGLATHYHTFAVTPAWNRTLVMTDAVGAHFFHRWKGYWGTAAAFSQRYVGGEPLPGPHPAAAPVTAAPATAAASVPAVVARANEAVPPGEPVSDTAASEARNNLPPPPTVLERWRESGQPLR